MANYETITLDRPEEGLAVLTLNRPKLLNAITWEMVDELHACLSELEDDLETRVLILTGAGRGFCSGTDLKSGRDETVVPSVPDTVRRGSRSQRKIGDVVLHMRKIPQPIVAAVNGVAAGGGFSFSMAADVRIAARSARFICSFINIGLSSGDVGSSYFLPRLLGMSRAADLLLTGREMSSEEAERVGYVSKTVDDDRVMEESLAIARQMLGKSPFGLRMTKEILNQSIDSPSLEASLYLENRTQTLATLTGDFRVAMEAFRKKEPVKYPKESTD